jgi:hypothetical protein
MTFKSLQTYFTRLTPLCLAGLDERITCTYVPGSSGIINLKDWDIPDETNSFILLVSFAEISGIVSIPKLCSWRRMLTHSAIRVSTVFVIVRIVIYIPLNTLGFP